MNNNFNNDLDNNNYDEKFHNNINNNNVINNNDEIKFDKTNNNYLNYDNIDKDDNCYFIGDTVFLYVNFKQNNKDVIQVNNPQIRILHSVNNNIYEDLPWTNLNYISNSEYCYNYIIPNNSDVGCYNVFYKGIIDNKTLNIMQTFFVINKSEKYNNNVIKIYGYIDDIRNQIGLEDVELNIKSNDTLFNVTTYTSLIGYWYVYLYPNNYNININKEGYINQNINFNVGNNNNVIKFNNISLQPDELKTNGNGIYEIKDKLILNNGIPLNNLKIEAFDINDINNNVAYTYSDNNGYWILNLDKGNYFIKITGNAMNKDFNDTYKLRIYENGKFNINTLFNNANVNDEYLNNGDGDIIYSDIILNNKNKPIVDVQVTAYLNNKPIAEDYTDINGKYTLKLNHGKYTIRIYHPLFKQPQNITIDI